MKSTEQIYERKALFFPIAIISCILMILPLLVLSEEMIVNTKYLKMICDNFSEFFPAIQAVGQLSARADLQYTAMFQYSFALIIGPLLLPILFFTYIKAYLCSWGICRNCKKKYIFEKVKKHGYSDPFLSITLIALFLFLFLDKYYFFFLFDTYYIYDGHRIQHIYLSKIGLAIITTIIPGIYLMITMLVLEFIARLVTYLKWIKNLFNFKK